MTTRKDCKALDAQDPLAPLRELFTLPEGVIYLDGNSLGVMPSKAPARLQEVVQLEWGRGLIRSWNTAGWIDLPRRLGDKIAPLVGAGPGEIMVSDSTSVNLFKVLSAAVALVAADASNRKVILSERSNFPTDLYIADTLARQHGMTLKLVNSDEIEAHLNDQVAVLMLTHVNYRTGLMHDMTAVTLAAHAAGALMVWDLAHSAGAVPVNLKGHGPSEAAADFAVGCGYKYLNGGPGAPAFLWAHPWHTEYMDSQHLRQPLSGWLGHQAPFDFKTDYHPAAGVQRFACGTPPVLSMSALECGLDVFAAAEPLGGMEALRVKSVALTSLFIKLVEEHCEGQGLTLFTPRDSDRRGSQVSFSRAVGGYAIMQALIARGVIGDFRAPDILRFGFTPLYTRYVDVWDAMVHLVQVMQAGEWREERFNQRAAVT
jgi:kynureninase